MTQIIALIAYVVGVYCAYRYGRGVGFSRGYDASFDQKLEYRMHYLDGVGMQCDLPPAGWVCTRTKGHEGPCAAYYPNVK